MPWRHGFLNDDCGIISLLEWFYLTSVLSHMKWLFPLKSQVLSPRRSDSQIATDLRQPCSRFIWRGEAARHGSGSNTPILQGALVPFVPSAGGRSGGNCSSVSSPVPASGLSCQTGYQTGIPASTRLRLTLTCWQRERDECSLFWKLSFLRHLGIKC